MVIKYTFDVDSDHLLECEFMEDLTHLYNYHDIVYINCQNNKFAKEKNNFMIKEYHKHLMAYRIQYLWKNALVNPNCRIGINKIRKDMDYAGL